MEPLILTSSLPQRLTSSLLNYPSLSISITHIHSLFIHTSTILNLFSHKYFHLPVLYHSRCLSVKIIFPRENCSFTSINSVATLQYFHVTLHFPPKTQNLQICFCYDRKLKYFVSLSVLF